jgi:hypothetical protein
MLRLPRPLARAPVAVPATVYRVRCPLYGVEVLLSAQCLDGAGEHQCHSDDPCPLQQIRAAAQSARNGPTHIRLRRAPRG